MHRDPNIIHANFVEHLNTVLDVRMIALIAVYDAMHCASRCLENDRCISYNSAAFPDASAGKFEYQLLANDKYRSSKSLSSNKSLNHYSIMVRTSDYWSLYLHLLHELPLCVCIIFFLRDRFR